MALPRSIFHPTDFSPTADCALAWAIAMARPAKATLRLLHALDSRGAPVDAAALSGQFAPRLAWARDLGVAASSEVAAGIYPGPVVLEAVRDADLMVVGRVGERDASAGARRRRGGLGSLADEVVRFGGTAVLVVPAAQEAPLGAASVVLPPVPVLRRVLVPIDFSPASRAALEIAAELAGAHGASLDLLHVIERPPLPEIYALSDPLLPALPAVEERARLALSEMAAAVAPGVSSEVHVALGRASAEIEAFAETRGVDLVVIANRGLSLLARLLLGTTAEEVVRDSDVPVLVVRSD